VRGLVLFLAFGLLGWGQQFERIIPYLGLTEAQLDQILQRGDDFLIWESGRRERVHDLRTEIAAEIARSPLDPMALGVRYVEIETIRREIVARRAGLVPGNVALLTAEQRGKLAPLEASMRLRGTWAEVELLGLVAVKCQAMIQCIPAPYRIPRPLVLDSLPVQAAKDYLGLTDSQIGTLREQRRAFWTWAGQRDELAEVMEKQIAMETARSPLDPMALGVRYVAVEMIRREIQEEETAWMAANLRLLTEGQRGRLAELERQMNLADVGDEARALQVLAPDCTGRYFVTPFLGQVGGLDTWCDASTFVPVP
jgi:hypothetical protein